ncbi:MAG TPA: PqqD family peptide modification chaperone [Allosphingosinicella sp.]
MADDMLVLRRAGLIEAEVDGELVALHVDNGTCYGFNATATRIWGMIEEPKRVSELRDALLEEYDVPPDVCEAELVDLLKDLEGDGLIELRAVAD